MIQFLKLVSLGKSNCEKHIFYLHISFPYMPFQMRFIIEKIDVCCYVKKLDCFCVFKGLNSEIFVGHRHISSCQPSCKFLPNTLLPFSFNSMGK